MTRPTTRSPHQLPIGLFSALELRQPPPPSSFSPTSRLRYEKLLDHRRRVETATHPEPEHRQHDIATHANEAASRRLFEELWGKGDLAIVDELASRDLVERHPGVRDDVHGPIALKQLVLLYRTAFPDLHVTVDDAICDRDKVVIRWTARGTHEGELMGLVPTGVAAAVSGITIDRYADGKLIESWTSWDTMALLEQLGAAPPPGSLGDRVGRVMQRVSARRLRRRSSSVDPERQRERSNR